MDPDERHRASDATVPRRRAARNDFPASIHWTWYFVLPRKRAGRVAVHPGITRMLPWIKLGQILQPNPSVEWMNLIATAAFVDREEAGSLRVYFTGRSQEQVHRIGTMLLTPHDRRCV